MENENTQIDYLSVDVLKDNMEYWFVRTNGGSWYKEFLAEEHCTIIDSEINLEKLKELKSKNEISNELHRINNQKIEKLKDKAKQNKTSKELLKVELQKKTKSKRSITIEANRIYNFVHGIKKNDLIIIPSKSSKEYKIGLVASEVKKYDDKQMSKIKDNSFKTDKTGQSIKKYNNSNNRTYRKIIWLKTIKRKQIDPSILNHLNMHQAIANLSDFKNLLNQLISPVYIQNEKLHISVKVDRKNEIDNDLWLDFHKLIKLVEQESQSKVDAIKVDVQSPGLIEIVLNIDFELIESYLKNSISVLQPYGILGVAVLLGNAFKGSKITKIAGIEFTETDSEAIKKAREDHELTQLRVDTKRLLLEENVLDKKLNLSLAFELTASLIIDLNNFS
ncbi:hypothetical protein, partial [Mammaliicoccus sciuri]|uniref:hypothetical protein n=1 Tax=Mammaliicoccus sciuri TaxID=1296 RepID=UPI0037C9D469